MKRSHLAVMALPLTLLGCGGANQAASALAAEADRTFVATSVPWNSDEEPIDRAVVKVGNGRVSLEAECNQLLSSGARVEDGRLMSDEVSQTDIGCAEPRSSEDEWLGELLAAAPSITLDGNVLELASTEATLRATER